MARQHPTASAQRAINRCRRPRFGFTVMGVAVALSVTGCGRNDFVPFTPTADLVPLVEEDVPVQFGAPSIMVLGNSSDCSISEVVLDVDPGPNASEWRQVIQGEVGEAPWREVSFKTVRFGTTQELDAQMDSLREQLTRRCSESDTGDDLEMIRLDGLPSGSFSVRSRDAEGRLMLTAIVDRTRQIMMAVEWVQGPEPIAIETYVDVVSTAWSEFESQGR